MQKSNATATAARRTSAVTARPSLLPLRGGLSQQRSTLSPEQSQRSAATSHRSSLKLSRSLLRRSAAGEHVTSAMPPVVDEVLRSPGQPLDATTRRFMETRIGGDFTQVPVRRETSSAVLGEAGGLHEEEADRTARRVVHGTPANSRPMPLDFNRVRVHVDEKAAQSAQALRARAYTTGLAIVFGRGEYAPHEPAGRWLLAHELTHVAQQREHAPSAAPLIQRVSIFQSIARFFGGGTFSDKELHDYLGFLEKNRKIEGHFDSDNKAREVVKRWKAGTAGYAPLIIPIRILLINEMADGYLSNDDQDGILDLLVDSIPAERAHILPAIAIDMLKTRFDGARKKRLDAILDNHEIDVLGLSDEWSVPETKKINTRLGDGTVLRRLLAAGFRIFRFETAFDKWRYDDGRREEDELKGLLGNTDSAAVPKRIRLRKSLTNEVAASTLFHESDHALAPEPTTQDQYLEGEVHARVEGEGFAFRHGLPETESGYRTAEGKPDVAAIRRDVRGSNHYNPTGRTRIGRRYVAEIETKGWGP